MRGRAYLQWLETVPARQTREAQQPVLDAGAVGQPAEPRLSRIFRTIASGSVKPGDSVRISPSGIASRVKEIAVWGGAKPKRSRASPSPWF